jgi:membrane-bound serine protease (ClpP class)
LRTLLAATAFWITAFNASPLRARVIGAQVDSIVHPITAEIISSAIEQAHAQHADAVLIRLNTPGGLLDATRDIVERIFHSPVPVIMWVGPSGARAASAGFFLLEAGDIAAMAPGTNTGASHPVLASDGQMDPVMKQKIENDAAALMRSIASRRGRNVAAAEKTVRESVSYTDREALDQHLIDEIAPDEAQLLRQLEGREITRFDQRRQILHFADASIDPYRPSLRQRVMRAIADPNIALLLLVLGALGIYAEFSSPGLVFPGVAGAILILLGLSALAMFPIDKLGAALIALALIFFVLEAKFATHGILTAGGAVAMILGAVMLVDTNVPELRIRYATAIAITIPFAVISTFLFSIAMRARRNKVVTGAGAMVGETGRAIGELNPSGMVMVRGEYWNALADSRVPAAGKVRVTGIDGLTLRVSNDAPDELRGKE